MGNYWAEDGSFRDTVIAVSHLGHKVPVAVWNECIEISKEKNVFRSHLATKAIELNLLSKMRHVEHPVWNP